MKQSFKQFLKEAPLPDDWDKNTYSEKTSFAKRLAYAKERAQKIGSGSSRVAFIIPFENRKTVLKIAKNAKGMAQNEYEAQMLSDYYAKGLGITIPMIDYDEQSSRPTWIHTELAGKAKNSDFIKACGGTPNDLVAYAKSVLTPNRVLFGDPNKIDKESEFAQAFMDLIGNFDMPPDDFSRLANWGIYQGNLVIIDVGFNSDIQKQHYSR